jgi:hypothetical protein
MQMCALHHHHLKPSSITLGYTCQEVAHKIGICLIDNNALKNAIYVK